MLIITVLFFLIIGIMLVNNTVRNSYTLLNEKYPALITINHFTKSSDKLIHIHYYELINNLGEHPSVLHYESQNHFNGILMSDEVTQYINETRLSKIQNEFALYNFFIKEHNLTGFRNPEIIFIENGDLELIAGRIFTEHEMIHDLNSNFSKAIISKSFATHNNIWVGDSFFLSMESSEKLNFQIEIIGIRDFIERPELIGLNDHLTSLYSIQQNKNENEIYVPSSFVNSLKHFASIYLPETLLTGNISVGLITTHFILNSYTEKNDFLRYALDYLNYHNIINEHTFIILIDFHL